MATIEEAPKLQNKMEKQIKNNIPLMEKFLKEEKCVALVAPSFITDFSYPSLIPRLKKLGFDKVTELTFGAKMINRDYHELIQNSKKLIITSPCPGIITTIQNQFPELKKNLAKIDSPVVAMAKICRKHFPGYKIIFISPCDFKKVEAENSKYIDGVIDYDQLRLLFKKNKIRRSLFKKKYKFDKFYNDYTKIYPLSGGLATTAHVKDLLEENEFKIIDGIKNVMEFLKNPDPDVKFLDCLFCEGGCIGGPHTNKKFTIKQKHKAVTNYLRKSKRESILESRKGLIKKAEGIKFSGKCWFS